jgi:hypothetical protein
MTPEEFTKEMKYLPKFMRDFHDQKDLFKAIEELYKNDEGFKRLNPNFRDSHIYTIDFFLWFMGQHGYKLQKVKHPDCKFYDIQETIKEMKDRRVKGFAAILQTNLNPQQP